MSGTRVRVERARELAAPAAAVWRWMCETPGLPLFTVNLFHHAAALGAGQAEEPACRPDAVLAVGSRVAIAHRFLGRRELRLARIAHLGAFPEGGGQIAWGETRAGGVDWFPHGQRFEVRPLGAGRSRLVNRLRGTFRLPGAGWWLVPWYRHVLPRILDAENARIARAVEGRAG